jgi:hypothetical protein
MSVNRRRRPQLESLESKLVLSTIHPGVSAAEVSLAASSARHRLNLRGTVDGTTNIAVSNPDAGSTQEFKGSGNVVPLGAVNATGSLQLPGNIAKGRATGTMTLTNTHGSITIKLVGPLETGFSAAPSTLAYTVTGGTGSYRGAKGSGHATLHELQADATGIQPGGPDLGVIVGSLFILNFGR